MKIRWGRIRMAVWVGLLIWTMMYVPSKLEERYGWELGAIAEGRQAVSNVFGVVGMVKNWIYCDDHPTSEDGVTTDA